MTRILQLNAATEKQLLRARQFRDVEAERVAAKIIADVRKRGNAALFSYAKQFDGRTLNSRNIYLPCRGAASLYPELRKVLPDLPGRNESTSPRVAPAFLRAIK